MTLAALDLEQAPALYFRQVVAPEGEAVFVVEDQRVIAGRILDEHHTAQADGNSYGWMRCEVCQYGVIPKSKTRPARHLPYAAGVDKVMRWVDGRHC